MPPSGKLTLADIEAQIMEIKKRDQAKSDDFEGQRDWLRVVTDVEPADIPKVLDFIDKNLSKQIRDSYKEQLMERWAAIDVAAAMAYANALPDHTDREWAIGVVAGIWAKKILTPRPPGANSFRAGRCATWY